MQKNITLIDIFISEGSLKIKIIKSLDFIFGNLLMRVIPQKTGKAKKIPPINERTRILIIRPGGIGDAVFLLPLLKELKKINPGLQTDILCEKRNAAIFSSQKNILNNIFLYDSLTSVIDLLKNKYNIIIDTEQWHYLSSFMGRILKSDYFLGFSTQPLRAKAFTHSVNYDIDEYELLNFYKLFALITPKIPCPNKLSECFEIPQKDSNWANDQVPNKSISIFLGGNLPAKRLIDEQYLKSIRSFLEKDFSVILLGGNDVTVTSLVIEKKIKNKKLINFVGKTSLLQSAALMKHTKLLLSTDSGMLHLACALDIPTISIFGPSDQQKWGPKGKAHTIINQKLPCSPCACFSYTLPTCKGKYQCLRDIDANHITRAINKALSGMNS